MIIPHEAVIIRGFMSQSQTCWPLPVNRSIHDHCEMHKMHLTPPHSLAFHSSPLQCIYSYVSYVHLELMLPEHMSQTSSCLSVRLLSKAPDMSILAFP